MKIIYVNIIGRLVVFLCSLNTICGRRFAEENYYPNYYDGQTQYAKTKYYIALEKLKHEPQWISNWPDPSVKLGQVSGVALDQNGLLLVFHRATKVWDATTFTDRNVYQGIGEPPLSQPTVLVFNDTGKLVDKWGENLFHLPHGITVDTEGNVWLTDVALHQVFKFTKNQWQKPALTLGEKFVPGDDNEHFCKPSAVAVLTSGDFFVADGYCNSRIIKFAPDGTRILQWGKDSGQSPYVLHVPHALTVAADRGLVCAADRERGRVACFRADNGTYVIGFSSWLVGDRLFSAAYAPVQGGRLYVVNGPTGGVVPVRGYVIDFTTGKLIQTFAPASTPLREFSNPHDIVTNPEGSKVYVAELNPYKVYKFVDRDLVNESRELDVRNVTERMEPTSAVENLSSVAWPPRQWRVAGAASAALLAAAVLALLAARHRVRRCVSGRKGVTRRRWEYGHSEFKLRRLLERRRFTRVHSDDSDEEPAPMLPPQPPANA